VIPLVLTTAVSLGKVTFNSVTMGSIAGFSYAHGRKAGRKICQFLDDFETKLTQAMK